MTTKNKNSTIVKFKFLYKVSMAKLIELNLYKNEQRNNDLTELKSHQLLFIHSLKKIYT